jgi:hypothetical protein
LTEIGRFHWNQAKKSATSPGLVNPATYGVGNPGPGILFKIIVQHVRLVKGMGTCGSGERNAKIWIDFRKSSRFSLISPLSQEREKSSRPVFTMCGEPCLVC